MRQVISKIFQWVRALFLRLRVMVTLELGRDKVKEDEIPNDTNTGGKTDD